MARVDLVLHGQDDSSWLNMAKLFSMAKKILAGSTWPKMGLLALKGQNLGLLVLHDQ